MRPNSSDHPRTRSTDPREPEAPCHSTAGFQERRGMEVFGEDTAMVTQHTSTSGVSSSLPAGQILTVTFSCHRRYLGALN